MPYRGVLDRSARRVPSGFFDVDHGELLYDDELGLPK
jgi:hypothetical protein